MINLTAINESTTLDTKTLPQMLGALEDQWNQELGRTWGVESCNIKLGSRDDNGSNWWLVFLEDSDQAGALAYHDLTPNGHPMAKVFVKTLLDAKMSVSAGASHEMCEMAVDPWLNMAFQDPMGRFWAGEIADPVQDDSYGYMGSKGVLVSDFVLPAWFGHEYSDGPFDFRGKIMKPFEVMAGGYAQVFDPNVGWQQIYGSQVNPMRRQLLVGSRRERMLRKGRWERSAK